MLQFSSGGAISELHDVAMDDWPGREAHTRPVRVERWAVASWRIFSQDDNNITDYPFGHLPFSVARRRHAPLFTQNSAYEARVSLPRSRKMKNRWSVALALRRLPA